MVGSANVVAWNECDERSSSVGTGWLHTAQGVGGNGTCAAITIAPGLDTGVDTGGVGSPHLDIGVGDGLARGGVDHIDVQVSDRANLAGEDV